MGLVLLALLALPCVCAKPLYTLDGDTLQSAPIRRNNNLKALQLSGQYMDLTSCRSKVGNMNVSPFTFYRGSNQLFFRDMDYSRSIQRSAFYDATATPWIQGDMHVLNAGRFDNDQGTIVYDLNDFDEAFVANYLYDVYRLAASIVLVSRNNSLQDDVAAECVEAFAGAYRDQLKDIAKGDSTTFTLDFNSASGMLRRLLADKSGKQPLGDTDERKARRLDMLKKWTQKGADGRVFRTDSMDLEPASEAEWSEVMAAFEVYYTTTVTGSLRGDRDYFAVQDITRRLNAGTGSLGTDRYYILIAGDSRDSSNDDRILDVKRQGKPSVYKYLSIPQRAAVDDHVDNDADRAVQAYKSLVSRADDHLGYMEMFGGNFSVRERSPYKKPLVLTGLHADDLTKLSKQWGVMLANAHARSAKGNEVLGVPSGFASKVADATKGRRSDFTKEVSDFALSYADQVLNDFRLFLDSEADGELCAERAT